MNLYTFIINKFFFNYKLLNTLYVLIQNLYSELIKLNILCISKPEILKFDFKVNHKFKLLDFYKTSF